ncbi:hypothetical protein [uncultured Tenacibaculum sp.]|uniref:hypothetical protein n=1 Tax=uncultured Tenacibaculum sp. TaxID=174713 RepID=UPI00263028F8|nr:hypothetical protein [uncultured Tenacibaculum sp.]
MKTSITKNILAFAILSFFISCSSEELVTNDDILQEQNTSNYLNETNTIQAKIPNDKSLKLFCKIGRSVNISKKPSGSLKKRLSPYYTENSKRTSQTFKLGANDFIFRKDGKTKHSRCEAFLGAQAPSKGKYKTLEAKMKVNTALKEELTLAQYFSVNKSKPQIALRIDKRGRLKINRTVLTNENMAGKSFFIRIEADGHKVRVKYAKSLSALKKKKSWDYNQNVRYKNTKNQFRWGAYYNSKTGKNVSNTVTNLFTKR